jgi:hypothetical protein
MRFRQHGHAIACSVASHAFYVRTTASLDIVVTHQPKPLKILFLHGWNSVVGGVKPTYLIEQGNEVCNPKLSDDDWEDALSAAQLAFDTQRPDVIVGSSRGGAVAMNLQSGTVPMVLLCPAWKRWGSIDTVRSNTLILHSREDEVIPFADSEELVNRSELDLDALMEVGHDHRLADPGSLSAMHWACQILASDAAMTLFPSDPANSKPRNRKSVASQDDASYVCDACGEEIVIPLDLSEGATQRYVEDCPVCCRANVIHVHLDDDGNSHVWAEPEQDYD